MVLTLGEVKIINDGDLQDVLNMCHDDSGWNLDFHKKNIKVFTKKNELCSFSMLKAKVDFDDVSAQTAFDVLMDCQYRISWDEYMVEGLFNFNFNFNFVYYSLIFSLLKGYDHCYVNANSDIGYYCGKSPKPLKNRDFVMQRTWLDSVGSGSDKVVISHSVNHAVII